jgi:putative protease
MLKKMEILAPAGSMESLVGAINAGAKAVYLAGRRFGARAYAANFSDEALIDVIRYAHVRGVFVYVAVNTMIFDDEIDELLKYTDFLVEHDVDALIIQDLGVMHLLRKRYPNLDLHASTQTNAHSLDQVRFLKEIGINRVVLARETPIEVIKQIKSQIDIEIEVFVHGALCVCYSGQCLMSSMIGGRSGNRGECAQPCRLPYALLKDQKEITDNTYLLSTKDLMTLDYLQELMEIGVESIKIEGRMRKAEYVIQSVLSYKRVMDAIMSNHTLNLDLEKDKLMRVFNREFTKGYMFEEEKQLINHDLRPNHMGVRAGEVIDYHKNKVTIRLTDHLRINDGYRIIGDKDYGDIVLRILKDHKLVTHAEENDIIMLDVKEKVEIGSIFLKTLDQELEKELSVYLNDNYKTIHVRAEVEAFVGKPFRFTLTDGTHHVTSMSPSILEKGLTNPATKKMIIDQMTKLGNTPFSIDEIEVDTDEACFISVKLMNELRREAFEQLTNLRMKKRKEVIIQEPIFDDVDIQALPFESVIKITHANQVEMVKNLAYTTYIEDRIKTDESLPHHIPILKRIQMRPTKINQKSVVHEIGSLYANQRHYDLITSEFFNVANIYTAHLLFSYGVKIVTLSLELSRERSLAFYQNYVKTFNQKPNLQYVIYGRPELMISKYCPIQKTFKTRDHCLLCEKNQYALKDRIGMKFPLIHDGQCNIRIMHQKPLNLFNYLIELKQSGIQSFRLDLTTEKDQEIKDIISMYEKALIKPSFMEQQNQYSLGRYLK